MPKKPLNIDTEFTVGEEKVLNIILVVLFAGLFIYGLVDAILQHFNNGTYIRYICFFALIPASIFLKKAMSKQVYIRVNKTGLYENEKLVCTWDNFLGAKIDQRQRVFSISDNFILLVEYMKDGEEKGFRRKIPLTNTQNKSEEDVLEAVKFFSLTNTNVINVKY